MPIDPFSAAAVGLSIVSGGLQIWGSSESARKAKKMAEWQRHQFEQNAKIARLQGKDALRRGEKAANKVAQAGGQVIGQQRAIFASQGLDMTVGTPADMIDESIVNMQLDVQSARVNAWRESWGYEVAAQGYQTQGAMTVKAAKNFAENTMLSGYIGAAGSFASAAYYGRSMFVEGKTPPAQKATEMTLNTQDPRQTGKTSYLNAFQRTNGRVEFDDWIRFGYRHIYSDLA